MNSQFELQILDSKTAKQKRWQATSDFAVVEAFAIKMRRAPDDEMGHIFTPWWATDAQRRRLVEIGAQEV